MTSSVEFTEGDDKIMNKTAAILKTQPEYVIKTCERFLKEIYDKQNSKKS